MSFRQLTKHTDTHFLVRYRCDNKLQIRTAGFIRSEEIAIDETYQVQWGNKGQADVAVIIAAGSEKEMRRRLSDEQGQATNQKTKAQKRKTTESNKTASGKPIAKVLRVASPPGFYPVTTVDVTSDSVTVTTTPVNTTPRTTTCVTSVTTTDVQPVFTATPLPSSSSEHQPAATTVVTNTETLLPSLPSVSGTPSTPSRPEFAFRSVRPTTGNQLHSYLQSIDAAQGSMLREIEKLKRQGEATARKYSEIIDNQRALREMLERLVEQVSRSTAAAVRETATHDFQTEDVPCSVKNWQSGKSRVTSKRPI